jgi:hypothetical protein
MRAAARDTSMSALVRELLETLLSEDLAHGRDYGGVKVANPFRP